MMAYTGALFVTQASAKEIPVASAAEITQAMKTASPGDVLVMANGVWTNQRIDFAGDGTDGAPITLRAETPGGVTLNGHSTLSISGDYLVVDGLNFEGGALTRGTVVQFRGSNGNANHSRLTNSAIVDYNPPEISTRYFWVSIYGDNNRVDHNYFAGQRHSGVTVVVRRDGSGDYHRIDNNHFADRPKGNANGFETIRIGTSGKSLSDSFTVVENNLFERVDGEIEIISNKSGKNVFRHNTFLESAGALTLRHGNGSTVDSNFFLGRGKSKSGGVRIIGEDHTIINNYFYDIGAAAGGAIAISTGLPDSPLNGYMQVKNAVIAHNTIVHVKGPAIQFSSGYRSENKPLLAEGVTIANNLIDSGQNQLFAGHLGTGWAWEGNIAHGESLGPVAETPGITAVDPQLVLGPDGLYRPGTSSPAINAAVGDYRNLLANDTDGPPRISLHDVGAGGRFPATIARVPLFAGDVGPDWLEPGSVPSGGGGNADGYALQAESYRAIFNPDGDGPTWTRQPVAEALGGEVIRATRAGKVVHLNNEPQDAVAIYEVELQTAAMYTPYYRVRLVDESSNPAKGRSSGGAFVWIKASDSFTISSSDVGVPLEFRVGMREQLTECDALVLHRDANLSDAELDLFVATVQGGP